MRVILLFCGALSVSGAFADEAELTAALADARSSCAGISDSIKKLQVMAGINTAVTGIGTVAAGGALFAGIKKAQTDKVRSELGKMLAEFARNPEEMSDVQFLILLDKMAEKISQDKLKECLAEAEAESKRLGYWRTGLMAGNTATHIGGAIISHKNKNDGGEIKDMIAGCVDSAQKLHNASMQAVFDGVNAGLVAEAREIADKCGGWNMKDATSIPKWQDVAKWTSIVGIGVGAAGTTTSIIANTEKVREAGRQTPEGKKAEEGWNLASNILAGTATAASGVATGFNIATLAKIDKLLKKAGECEEALR